MARSPTGSNGALTSGESTVSGVAPRIHEKSFGFRVLDLVNDLGGEGSPQLPPQAREHAAALVDAGMEQALAAARGMATNDAAELRKLQRWLPATMVAAAFAVVGVVLWFVTARLDAVESGYSTTQDELATVRDDVQAEIDKAAEHRSRLDANVKTLAGHAVALTEAVNSSAQVNYDVLKAIADKIKAPIPGSAQRPEKIEAPVTLRYIAGER